MAINVNRINPNRLGSPSDINEALDAISAELTRLRKLQERVLARKDEIVAEAALKGIPGLIDCEDPADFIARLMADAMAYRELGGDEPEEVAQDATSDALDEDVDGDDGETDEADSIFG